MHYQKLDGTCAVSCDWKHDSLLETHLHDTGRKAGKLLGHLAALLLCFVQLNAKTLFLFNVQQKTLFLLRNAILGRH